MGFIHYKIDDLVHVILTSPTAKRNEPCSVHRQVCSLFQYVCVGFVAVVVADNFNFVYKYEYSLFDDDEDRTSALL